MDTLQARVTEFERVAVAREGHVQEEIAQSLARKRERALVERDACAIAIEREKSQLITKIGMLR